jgi:hypothetical protein
MMRGFINELKKPVTAVAVVISVITTIVGIAVSYYFYLKSEKAGQIAMVVDQVQVLDKTQVGSAPLRVLDANGNSINENVFAASVTIWNIGNAEIKKTDVRRPFRIKLGERLVPLDLSISRYSSDNLGSFNLAADGSISWEHFDPGEGFKVRVIYVNERIQPIKLEGSAFGVGPVLEVAQTGISKRGAIDWIFNVASPLAASIVFFFVFWMNRGPIRGADGQLRRSYFPFVFLAVSVLLFVLILIGLVIDVQKPLPPF